MMWLLRVDIFWMSVLCYYSTVTAAVTLVIVYKGVPDVFNVCLNVFSTLDSVQYSLIGLS